MYDYYDRIQKAIYLNAKDIVLSIKEIFYNVMSILLGIVGMFVCFIIYPVAPLILKWADNYEDKIRKINYEKALESYVGNTRSLTQKEGK